jgi:hypothetical protein
MSDKPMTESRTLTQLQTSGVANTQAPAPMSFFTADGFALMQRIATAFTQSDMVPQQYQGNLPNCLIALDMAHRMGANPLLVMQNLYVVHGTPGWSSKFLIATVNTCGRFSAMRYEWKGEPGQADYGCRAWAIELETGERLDGIWVTWNMVKAEGWSAKKGSKWLTMPDQMFIYRAAAFWQRVYAPEISMGLSTAEEAKDVFDAGRGADGSFSVNLEDLRDRAPAAKQVKPKAEKATPEAVNKETGEINQDEHPEDEQEPAQEEQEEEVSQASTDGLDSFE